MRGTGQASGPPDNEAVVRLFDAKGEALLLEYRSHVAGFRGADVELDTWVYIDQD